MFTRSPPSVSPNIVRPEGEGARTAPRVDAPMRRHRHEQRQRPRVEPQSRKCHVAINEQVYRSRERRELRVRLFSYDEMEEGKTGTVIEKQHGCVVERRKIDAAAAAVPPGGAFARHKRVICGATSASSQRQ